MGREKVVMLVQRNAATTKSFVASTAPYVFLPTPALVSRLFLSVLSQYVHIEKFSSIPCSDCSRQRIVLDYHLNASTSKAFL